MSNLNKSEKPQKSKPRLKVKALRKHRLIMRLYVNRYYRRIVLIVVCLMLLLNGCAQKPIERVEYLFPPQIFLIPCTQTAFTGTTYGEAIAYLRQVQYERDICASRLGGVIDWYKEKNREAR